MYIIIFSSLVHPSQHCAPVTASIPEFRAGSQILYTSNSGSPILDPPTLGPRSKCAQTLGPRSWNPQLLDPSATSSSSTFQVSFVVKAVSALTAAFRLVQLDSCGQSVEEACLREVVLMIMLFMSILVCLREVGMMIIMRKKYFLLWLIIISFVNVLNSHPLSQLSPGLHDEILSNLHKLSFTRWHHQIFSSVKIPNIHQVNCWTNISQISAAWAGKPRRTRSTTSLRGEDLWPTNRSSTPSWRRRGFNR